MKQIIALIAGIVLLAGCVTEEVGSPFKKPTPEGLEKAANLYVDIAYQFLQDRKYEEAMFNVRKALEKSPDFARAHMALAQTYQFQGDNDKARDAYKKTLRIDNKYSHAHMAYGQFLFGLKEYKEACKEFQIASADDFYENRSAAYANLGVCLLATGDEVAAEAAMKRSMALNEKEGFVLLDLAELKFKQNRLPESKQFFDLHVKNARDSAQSLSPRALWLGIRLERKFGNKDAEASHVLFLKNTYPYSKEWLEYQEWAAKQ